MSTLGWIVLFVLMLAVGPLLTIAALNILFPALAIPYTFGTWAAVLWLGGATGVLTKKT